MEWSVLAGEAWTREAPDGAILVADNGMGGRPVTFTASGGAGFTVDLDPGRWWLAQRAAADEPLQRIGTLDVVPLADPIEVRLVQELADLDREIADLDSTLTFMRTNSTGGEAQTRSTLARIREARRQAESRLTDYRHRRAGLSPLRHST